MSKRYCLSCNFGYEANNGKIPNFCPNCGKSYIDSAASVIQKPVFTPTVQQNSPQSIPSQNRGKLNRQIEEDNIDYPEDAVEVPQIDKIDFNLNISNLRPNRENGKDVFMGGSASEAREVLGKKPAKVKITKSQEKQNKNMSQDCDIYSQIPKRCWQEKCHSDTDFDPWNCISKRVER